jgi:membrane protease YdiL (CAAX protease family)
LIWYAWHLPLGFVMPQANAYPAWQTVLSVIVLAIGSVCTFIYLAYVYVKSESVWVTAIAHIAMNNSASSFSYFATVQNQMLANVGLALAMVIVTAVLYATGEMKVFKEYFAKAT